MSTTQRRRKTRKNARRDGAVKGEKLSIREIEEHKDDYTWTTFLVQGWQGENGRWQKKRFRNRSDAEAFVALKAVELLNQDSKLREVVTTLSADQVKEAEAAFNRLAEMERDGDTTRKHTLSAAVEFYAKHFDPGTTKTVLFSEARQLFLRAKESEGVRPRSIVQLGATLRQFENAVDDCSVSEIGTPDVENYLNRLRSKDGKQKAATKTFNNYRADLNVFFVWCMAQDSTAENGRKIRWLTGNPVSGIKKKRASERSVPETLSVTQARLLLRHVEHFKGTQDGAAGIMAPYFALALFAGLRTGDDGELHKLASHPESERLIDLKRGVIHIKPEISKTGQYRQIIIRPSLHAWLSRYGTDLLPANAVRHVKTIRKSFKLGHGLAKISLLLLIK